MKPFQKMRVPLNLFFVLLLVFIQFPAIALAFDDNHREQRLFQMPSDSLLSSSANRLLSPSVVFSNPASITITDRVGADPNPRGVATPYPSTINVTGLSGTLSDINVTLTGITSPRPRNHDMLLVAPTGQTFVMLADVGGTLGCGLTNVTITLDDSAATQLKNNDVNGCPPDTAIVSGTYRPTNYTFGVEVDTFPSPAPTAPYNQAAPTGSSTFASVFNGVNPNGTWSLYITDDEQGGGNSTISGGWSIDITTAGGVTPTTTSVVSSLNPANTGQTITFTSTTVQVPSGTPVNAGTVAFTNNGVTIAGCGSVAVNASGVATCSTTSPQGTRNIVATYSGTATFGTSNGTLTQTVNSPTIVTGSQFCNNGGLAFPDVGAADVYPANIVVSGLVGTITKVTTQVNGLTAPRPNNLDLLLVGPTSAAFQFMSDVGDAVNPVSNIFLTIDDAAASAFPNGTALSSGTFRPGDFDTLGTDTYPAPAPTVFSRAAPTGSGTFSLYNGTNPNGSWSIYALDDGAGGGASTINGLCLNFTLAKLNTTTTVTSSSNPVVLSQNVTFTATVTSTQTPSGSVQFFDGATSLGIVALNGSGVATLTTSTLPFGTRSITAQYLGANVGAGGGGFNASTSNTLSQIVRAPTAAHADIAGRVIASSGRGISKAVITLTDRNGNLRYATTNSFGFYRFIEVAVGETYILNVKAKNKNFNPQVLSLTEENYNLNFLEVR